MTHNKEKHLTWLLELTPFCRLAPAMAQLKRLLGAQRRGDNMSTRIFVAHSEKDSDLVKKLMAAITSACQLDPTEVFVSSEGSIRPDETFPQAITEALRSSEAIVVVLTPNSIWAPWVHFEAGGAHFAQCKSLFAVTAHGIGEGSLPSNLRYYSVRNLSEKKEVRQLLDRLQEVLGVPRRKTPKAESDLVRCASGNDADWTFVRSTTLTNELGGSPFELHHLIQRAKTSVFIIGMNLWSLSVGPSSAKLRQKIFRFLRGDRNRSVRILLQTKNNTEITEAWEKINPGFSKDLDDATEVFLDWLKAAQTSQTGKTTINTQRRRRLEIKVTDLVLVGFDIIDPQCKDGLMVIRHTLHRLPTSEVRPAFVLRGGKWDPVFNHYLSSWKKAFGTATRLDKVNGSA